MKKTFNRELKDVLQMVRIGKRKVEVLGSCRFKKNLHYGDVDLFQNVPHLKAADLKRLVQRLLDHSDYFIGDIKCGHNEKMRVIRDDMHLNVNGEIQNYNVQQVIQRLTELKKKSLIDAKTFKKLTKCAKSSNLDEIKKNLRLHVMRWTPDVILKGNLLNEVLESNDDAMFTTGMIKVDFTKCMHIDGNFGEFSIMYNAMKSSVPLQRETSLKSDVRLYTSEKQHFKALKRMASLKGGVYADFVNRKEVGLLCQTKITLENTSFLVSNHKKLLKDERIKNSLGNIEKKINFLQMGKQGDRLFNHVSAGKMIEAYDLASKRLNRSSKRFIESLNEKTI